MPNYTVRAVAGNTAKANGLFATRKITAGETIVEEDALLSLSIKDSSAFFSSEGDGDTEMVQSAIDVLETQKLNDFLALYHNEARVTTGWTANLDRVFTNRFEHHNHDGSIQISIFKTCARVNNSCVPNAYFYFGDEEKGVLRAVRDIAKNEEITIDYLGTWQTRNERANAMDWTRSGVVRCDCMACTDYIDDFEKHAFFETSEARRMELESLRRLLGRYYPSEENGSWTFREICEGVLERGGTLLGGMDQLPMLLLGNAKRRVKIMEREEIFDEGFLHGLFMVVYFDDVVRGGSEWTPLRERAEGHAELIYGEGWRGFVQVYTPY